MKLIILPLADICNDPSYQDTATNCHQPQPPSDSTATPQPPNDSTATPQPPSDSTATPQPPNDSTATHQPPSGSTAPTSRCSGAPQPLKTQTKRKTTAKLCPRKRTKLSDDPWVPELNLTMREKIVLESPDGMLTDKHVDAANHLLRSQFPHLQSLQSSLMSQSRSGFNPVEVSSDSVPKGM